MRREARRQGPYGWMGKATHKRLKYRLLLLYHEKVAVTRAAWIREKGCNSILGLLVNRACGSVGYDVTRTPGWNYSLFIYNLASG